MRRAARLALAAWIAALASTPVVAQALRDPTIPPPGMSGGAQAAAPSADDPPAEGGVAVIRSAGKPFLVVGSRLYGVGAVVDGARVERITETEVWLRKGGEVRKLAVFAGVERSAARPEPPVKCPPPSKKKSANALAPAQDTSRCADTTPQ